MGNEVVKQTHDSAGNEYGKETKRPGTHKVEIEIPDESGPGTPTLSPKEHHGAADGAMEWYKNLIVTEPLMYAGMRNAIYEMAADGQRIAEVMAGTMDRLRNSEPVSDRYMLGLCWFLRDLKDAASKPEERQALGLEP